MQAPAIINQLNAHFAAKGSHVIPASLELHGGARPDGGVFKVAGRGVNEYRFDLTPGGRVKKGSIKLQLD